MSASMEDVGHAGEIPLNGALGDVMEMVRERAALLMERHKRRRTVDESLSNLEQMTDFNS